MKFGTELGYVECTGNARNGTALLTVRTCGADEHENMSLCQRRVMSVDVVDENRLNVRGEKYVEYVSMYQGKE